MRPLPRLGILEGPGRGDPPGAFVRPLRLVAAEISRYTLPFLVPTCRVGP